jgi:hypothetical protein
VLSADGGRRGRARVRGCSLIQQAQHLPPESSCVARTHAMEAIGDARAVAPTNQPSTPIVLDAHGLNTVRSVHNAVHCSHMRIVGTRTEAPLPPLGKRKAPHSRAFSMRPSGLEPPRTVRSTRPSTLRVYQFRHGRRGGEYSRGQAAGGRLDRSPFWGPARAGVRARGPPSGEVCARRRTGDLRTTLVSVRRERYACEHMFVVAPSPLEQGAEQTWI